MKITDEICLVNFEFWSGAKEHAQMLTLRELQELDDFMSECWPDGMDATALNDWMWFDFENVCECIGCRYDVERDEVIRSWEEEENEDEETETE